MEYCPEEKPTPKGILKTYRRNDSPNASYGKRAKFDEDNVMETCRPADKDYGPMKINGTRTPYNYVNPENQPKYELDINLLAEKLRIVAKIQAANFGREDLSDDVFAESNNENVRRFKSERRRKADYKEFEAVRLARKLMAEELTDSDEAEGELTAGKKSTGKWKTSTDYLLRESSEVRNAAEEVDGAGALPFSGELVE